MAFIGKVPTPVPLTSSDITDGIITSAKITDGTIATADIADGAVTSVKTTGVGGVNTPAFLAYNSSAQNISGSTYTKVSIDTEVYDTANAFDNSSNYRFTPQTAGKYFVYGAVYHNWSSGWGDQQRTAIYKNGSIYAEWFNAQNGTGSGQYGTLYIATTVVMNGSSDYLELYGFSNATGASFNGNSEDTYFGAYKIIE